MKKSYVKPQVYFENFQLSANIAGTCGTEIDKSGAGLADANSCSFNLPTFGKIFLTEGICDNTPQDEIASSICYEHPQNTTRLFAS